MPIQIHLDENATSLRLFIRGRKLLAGQYFSSGVASGLDAPMPLKLGTQQLNVHGNELHLGERVVTWQ